MCIRDSLNGTSARCRPAAECATSSRAVHTCERNMFALGSDGDLTGSRRGLGATPTLLSAANRRAHLARLHDNRQDSRGDLSR